MKKTANYIVLGTIAACFLCFASCKSTKKKDAGAAAVNGGLEVSASEETDNKASEDEEAPAEDSDKKETSKKDSAKKETSGEAPANKDVAAPNAPGGNFTGWIKGTRRSISEKAQSASECAEVPGAAGDFRRKHRWGHRPADRE